MTKIRRKVRARGGKANILGSEITGVGDLKDFGRGAFPAEERNRGPFERAERCRARPPLEQR